MWEVMLIARDYYGDLARVSKHLEWPAAKVQAAFEYAVAFPEAINAAIAENDAMDFDALKRMLSQAEQSMPRR